LKTPCLEAIKKTAREHVSGPIGTWQYCSVLLPLVERDGLLYVLYELRSSEMETQPGEVSFPGGRIEDGEAPRETALRETVEELGVPSGAVEIVSELDRLVTYSNLIVHCFLGIIDASALEKASVNAAEVEEFFLVPLGWLLENDPEVYTSRVALEPAVNLPVEKLAPHGGYRWRSGTHTVPIYTWPDSVRGADRIIWGMTAKLTMAFVSLVRGVN